MKKFVENLDKTFKNLRFLNLPRLCTNFVLVSHVVLIPHHELKCSQRTFRTSFGRTCGGDLLRGHMHRTKNRFGFPTMVPVYVAQSSNLYKHSTLINTQRQNVKPSSPSGAVQVLCNQIWDSLRPPSPCSHV